MCWEHLDEIRHNGLTHLGKKCDNNLHHSTLSDNVNCYLLHGQLFIVILRYMCIIYLFQLRTQTQTTTKLKMINNNSEKISLTANNVGR